MQGALPSAERFEAGVKKFTILLLLLIGLLQYRLWLGDGSIRDLNRLHDQIEEMQREGAKRRDRNAALEAEVMDLKQGTDAIEELARQDLGMIKEGEVFVQVLEQHQEMPPPAATGKSGGKPVLQHTLERLLSVEALCGIAVALGTDDGFWPDLPFSQHDHSRILVAVGGRERCDSVLAGLHRLQGLAAENDWILVHDAARLCVTREDILKLMHTLHDHPVGGILALPSVDTLKGVSHGEIVDTVDRNHVWRALTPQMFRYRALTEALQQAAQKGLAVTDEASALELRGEKPAIVEGRPDNIKITRPEDLALATFYLEQQCCA